MCSNVLVFPLRKLGTLALFELPASKVSREVANLTERNQYMVSKNLSVCLSFRVTNFDPSDLRTGKTDGEMGLFRQCL